MFVLLFIPMHEVDGGKSTGGTPLLEDIWTIFVKMFVYLLQEKKAFLWGHGAERVIFAT